MMSRVGLNLNRFRGLSTGATVVVVLLLCTICSSKLNLPLFPPLVVVLVVDVDVDVVVGDVGKGSFPGCPVVELIGMISRLARRVAVSSSPSSSSSFSLSSSMTTSFFTSGIKANKDFCVVVVLANGIRLTSDLLVVKAGGEAVVVSSSSPKTPRLTKVVGPSNSNAVVPASVVLVVATDVVEVVVVVVVLRVNVGRFLFSFEKSNVFF